MAYYRRSRIVADFANCFYQKYIGQNIFSLCKVCTLFYMYSKKKNSWKTYLIVVNFPAVTFENKFVIENDKKIAVFSRFMIWRFRGICNETWREPFQMATLYCLANIALPVNNVKKYIFCIVRVGIGIRSVEKNVESVIININ